MNNKTDIEEDIKLTKEFIEYAQEMINDMEYERPVDVTIYQKNIQAIENILADREKLEKENKEKLDLLNKMKDKYKLALFIVIRNSTVLRKGIELQKSSKEINQMSYETMCEVLTMIDFKTAEKMYKEGKLK